MISVSKLLCGLDSESDGLRYDAAADSGREQITEGKQRRPVVVWNLTRRCNLYCQHCYAVAQSEPADGELSTAEGERLLEQLAEFGAPVVLFSGGEPLVRQDVEHLVSYASDLGLRPVLSTNGTLLTEERAEALAAAGIEYVGVSVDGLPERNDEFRGQEGAFEAAVRGINNSQAVGLKTGLRYTVTEANAPDLDGVIDLLHDEGIDRFCFYHLDYGGRGEAIQDIDLTPADRRDVIRRVCDLTREYHDRGDEIETLLVGNYADAGFLVEYAREELDDETAETIHRYLTVNGGDPAGERIADVDYQGNVHLTQFWQNYSLGNVRDRSFGDIWDDETNPLLNALRDRPGVLKGKCSDCRYANICRGGSRLRALAVHDDPFAPDPQCYLTPEERGAAPATDGGTTGDADCDGIPRDASRDDTPRTDD